MTIKLIKEIVESVAGLPAVKIVDLLHEKKDINEFLIAKKLGLTINQTRNLLYKLSSLGILSSIRKKDKRKGWYIYFWTLNVLRSLEILEDNLKQKIQQLEHELASKKSKRFYKCKICGMEVTEESALLTNFTCQECGEVYALSDNVSHIQQVEKDIIKLKRDLDHVINERKIEQEKLDKKMGKLIKRKEKERKEKSRKEREIRMKEKKKEEKKQGKPKKIVKLKKKTNAKKKHKK